MAFTRPTLWVVCGMIATGKSTVAKQLGETLDIRVYSTDVTRKILFDMDPLEHRDAEFNQDIYSEHATRLTYGKLLLLAQEELEKGECLILDGTFGKRHWREEAMRLASEKDADVVFVECVAPETVIKDRLAVRAKHPAESDARLKHYPYLRERFEPLTDIPDEIYITVRTDRPLHECMHDILASDYFLLSEIISV